MLSSIYRFHNRSSIRYIHREGKSSRGRLLTIKTVKNRRQTNKYAVVVSKKISKSAVRRNRIRRRVYEVLRCENEKLDQPYDILCMVGSPELHDMSHYRLAEAVKEQLSQAGLYKTII